MALHYIMESGKEGYYMPRNLEAIRFIKILDPGFGDYTIERKSWLPDDPDEYFRSIESRRIKK